MRVKRKAILFPFDANQDNCARYILAMELAKEYPLSVICFTALPKGSPPEALDVVYLHLLGLNGYYQSFVNDWQPISTIVKKVIRQGDFQEQLRLFMETSNCDWVFVSSRFGEG